MSDPILVETTGPWTAMPSLERVLCGSRGRRAADFHDACERILKREGWKVVREYRVILGDRFGFIDLVAYYGEIQLALELDNRSPRAKSIRKLATFPASWITGVLLRNPK